MLKFLRRSRKPRVVGYIRVSTVSQMTPDSKGEKGSDKNGK